MKKKILSLCQAAKRWFTGECIQGLVKGRELKFGGYLTSVTSIDHIHMQMTYKDFDIYISGTGRDFPYRKGNSSRRPFRTLKRAMQEISENTSEKTINQLKKCN